jgi:AraC family transcriptional regulator of adaptative response / DNA-3-methyladenine glycosylase II
MLQPADSPSLPSSLSPHICQQALDARDARFDGLFYVGIVTTRIYCRPTCPSRRATPDHRRFYDSAAAAERAGFRPCLRCRPELAPGLTLAGAVSRLASKAAHRICAGALNGHSVAALAAELEVSERHLWRALRREIGVSPLELAQTQRLLLAKRLLADTRLTVTDVAFASGFESLRRFNVAFHQRYGMSPSAVRRPAPAKAAPTARTTPATGAGDVLRMTLAYRPPFAWGPLAAFLGREATPGVERVEGRRYSRTVRIDGRSGVIGVADAPAAAQLRIDLSPSFLPVLMPLLSRLRQLFDLDAQPTVVDAHLERGGLGPLVRQRPGVRLPGALDGFEVGLRALLRGAGSRPGAEAQSRELAGRVARALGEPLETGIPTLDRLAPTAERVAEAGGAALRALGVPRRRAEAIAAFARAVAGGLLRLERGNDAAETQRVLREVTGIDERLATRIVMRALDGPDAFPAADRALQQAAGAASARGLLARAETWRPWRAYAALHLWLHAEAG